MTQLARRRSAGPRYRSLCQRGTTLPRYSRTDVKLTLTDDKRNNWLSSGRRETGLKVQILFAPPPSPRQCAYSAKVGEIGACARLHDNQRDPENRLLLVPFRIPRDFSPHADQSVRLAHIFRNSRATRRNLSTKDPLRGTASFSDSARARSSPDGYFA